LDADLRTDKTQVVIIGAGMAGIAAARHLMDKGFDVLMLEARPRIGGRIWTDNSLGLPIDLGASWIHNSADNPITGLATTLGASTVLTSYDNNIVYDKHNIVEADKPHEMLQRLHEMATGIEHDISVASALEKLTAEFGTLNAAEQRYFNKFLSEFQIINGADLQDQSLQCLSNFANAISHCELAFPHGYCQIIDTLSQGIPIFLSSPVY
jgi:polyamine oxidase